jgi:hypothetical protein
MKTRPPLFDRLLPEQSSHTNRRAIAGFSLGEGNEHREGRKVAEEFENQKRQTARHGSARMNTDSDLVSSDLW